MSTAIKVRPDRRNAGGPRKQELLLPGQWEKIQAREASSSFMLPVGCQWVQRDVLGIAEEVAARWPNLRVTSCSCGRCLPLGHSPHAVVEFCRDGRTRPVFGFTQFSRDVIDRLHAIHTSQNPHDAHLKHNAALRKALKAEAKAAKDADLEMAVAALESPKTTYTLPGGRKLGPGGPPAVKGRR